MGGFVTVLLLLVMAVPAVTTSTVAALELTPSSVHPGDSVTVNGRGFGACFPGPESGKDNENPLLPTVTVRWDGSNDNSVLTTVTLREDGSSTRQYVVPPDLPPDEYDVAAECEDPYGGAEVPGEITYAALTVVEAPTLTPASPTPSTRPRLPTPSPGPLRPSSLVIPAQPSNGPSPPASAVLPSRRRSWPRRLPSLSRASN